MQPTPKIRLEAFSDGVFAIAITLLALELRVPGLHIYNYNLVQFKPFVPELLMFALSFTTIAIYWVNHHQLLQNIATITRRRVMWLNMLFLLFIALIPFGTKVLSLNTPSAPATSIYALILFGASASFTYLRYWIHKCDGDFIIPMRRSLTGPILYFIAIFIPILSITLGDLFLAIPAIYYFLPKSSTKSL